VALPKELKEVAKEGGPLAESVLILLLLGPDSELDLMLKMVIGQQYSWID
jgi:hypothetical protein